MNCYILVGGRSRRMGTSKTELFLGRVAEAARPVFDALFAVQRPGKAAVSIPTIFEEPHDEDGPIFGIRAALRHASARCFILAVDYPFITSDVLRKLRNDGRVFDGQPLCAVWDPATLPEIEARIASGRRDLHGLWEQGMIDGLVPGALKNVNTPEDLEEDREEIDGR